MQSFKFVAERRADWERLRKAIVKIKRHGYRRLSPDEARDFPHLYRTVCTDFETAKTLGLSPETLAYLDTLVLQAHSLLYTSPKKTFRRLARLFWPGFPRAFAANIAPILVVTFLFFGVASACFTVVSRHPEYAPDLLPASILEEMKETYKETPLRSGAENIFMSGFYISNNVTIAFTSFILGLTFGFLTLYLVFYNGVVIGGVLGVVTAAGYGNNIFSFIIAHSVLELSGLCLAAGAGLSIGVTLIKAGEEKRSLLLVRKAREVVPLFLMAGLFITVAAFIEGFVSASPLPLAVKIIIASLSFAGLLFYAPLEFWRRFIVRFAARRRTRGSFAKTFDAGG